MSMRQALPAAVMIAAITGFTRSELSADEPSKRLPLRTEKVTRGDVAATVNATGTVEPEEVVEVGATVVGRVIHLGPDPRGGGKTIDFGSPVDKGTLLAEIDNVPYVAQVEQARAGCTRSEAEMAAARVKLRLAEVDLNRVKGPAKNGSAMEAEIGAAKGAIELAQLAVTAAAASLEQSHAALKQAQLNLEGTLIRSPIKGVILDRRVNVGQTVAATLNAPSLFLIAKDLKRLQVWASVNEVDIGRIRAGQTARFTVDAFPRETFQGTVSQIRLNATMTQNVVTYTVVLQVDNAKEKLLPYLTANVEFDAGRRKDVLCVPNTALRWRPPPKWIDPEAPQPKPGAACIWTPAGNFVRPVEVQIGLSDGAKSEITGGNVTEGMQIVVGGSPLPELGQSSSVTGQILTRLLRSPEQEKVLQRTLATMGTNVLLVLPGVPATAGASTGVVAPTTLTADDAAAIARECPAVVQTAPIARGRAQVTYGNRNWVPSTISGTTPSFLAARDWEDLAEGEAFTDRDVRSASKVCLIGTTLKRELFGDASPVGVEVRIQNVAFKVVGVLSRKGANVMGLDQDDIVLMPWTTLKQRVATNPAGANPPPANVDQIIARAVAAEQIDQAIDEIKGVLRGRHRIREGQADDFTIRDMRELIKALSTPVR